MIELDIRMIVHIGLIEVELFEFLESLLDSQNETLKKYLSLLSQIKLYESPLKKN